MADDYQTVDAFDKQLGQLTGLPDSLHSKAATITISNLVETATYIVVTHRVRDLGADRSKALDSVVGDTVFLQRVDRHGAIRIAIPPRVADAIARQRDGLGSKARTASGKAQAPRLRQLAAERKAAGIAPAFMKSKSRKARGK